MALERGKREILDWFNKTDIDPKITIYIYKDQTSLKEGLKSIFNKKVPRNISSYTILENQNKNIKRSINIIEPTKSIKQKEYNLLLFNELATYLIDYLYGNLPKFIVNGLIYHLNSTYKSLNIDYFLLRVNTDIPPSLDNIHLDPSYNEYSYITIKYIIDYYGKDYLLEKLCDPKQFTLHAENYLTESLLYYKHD